MKSPKKTFSSEQGQVPERASIDESKIAYQRPQPFGMVPDTFVGSALDLDGDEREWAPQSPTVSFKPLILSVSQGFYSTPSVIMKRSASARTM